MKETFYFSHDYNTRSDAKIKKLIQKHGYFGYGLFWCIVEDLYQNANALPTDYDGIAYEYRTDCNIIFSIINDFDLFTINSDFFGSLSVERRLNERNERSVKARESANKRWNKCERIANALPTQCESNAIKERKGKEIKENKIDFYVFWNLYEKKVGSKSKCEKKWNNLNLETQQKIIETLPKFKNSIKDKQYQPHPETYLNQERWNDDIQSNTEQAMNKLREFYIQSTQPHERERIHKIAKIFERTKILKYKPIDFNKEFMYEHLRACMQHFTEWEVVLEKFIFKNDNENKSIKQLFIEFKNLHRD